MVELFSRTSQEIIKSENIIPFHISDDISSLSAILLDEDYYNFLMEGRVFVRGLPVLSELYLIPFKAKAWIDLVIKKENGYNIDSRDINKHKNDIFRLSALISSDKKLNLNGSILEDMEKFINLIKDEPIDLKSIGIKRRTKEEIIDLIGIMGYDYSLDEQADLSELFYVLHETFSTLLQTVNSLPIAMSGLIDARELFNLPIEEIEELNKRLIEKE